MAKSWSLGGVGGAELSTELKQLQCSLGPFWNHTVGTESVLHEDMLRGCTAGDITPESMLESLFEQGFGAGLDFAE